MTRQTQSIGDGTHDQYTRVSWGVNTNFVGNTQMTSDFSTTQGVADQQFWDNSTLMAEIQYKGPGEVDPGEELILPHNTVNYRPIDPTAGLNFSNFTRDVLVDVFRRHGFHNHSSSYNHTGNTRELDSFHRTDYATDLPREFTDRGGALSSYLESHNL